MEIIDVAVVGGPDLAAVVDRRQDGLTTTLDITIANDGPVPARVERVAVPIESRSVTTVVAPGWDVEDPGADRRLAGLELSGVPAVATEHGTVGWLGAARHRGSVTVQRDGWLLTAWADLAGVLLGPGERIRLDPLWVGPGGLDALARAWAERLAPRRPVPAVTGVVVGAGRGALARALAAGEAPWSEGAALLVAGAGSDTRAVAVAASRQGVPFGVELAPFGSPGAPQDLTRPGALEAVRRAGVRAAEAGASWLVVTGAAGATLPRPRWGDAATTPVAALRAGLAAVRAGLGSEPILHVAGGPPPAVAGAADVIDTGPGWNAPDGLVPARRRAAFHRVVWEASPGPLPYDAAAARTETAGFSGPALLRPAGRQPDHPAG